MKKRKAEDFKRLMDAIRIEAKYYGYRSKREQAIFMAGWCSGFTESMYDLCLSERQLHRKLEW